jgi:hypothetical protein
LHIGIPRIRRFAEGGLVGGEHRGAVDAHVGITGLAERVVALGCGGSGAYQAKGEARDAAHRLS